MPGQTAITEAILEQLRVQAGHLVTAVASKDVPGTLSICSQMESLVKLLEVSWPSVGLYPDLDNLKRHIRFPARYAPRGRWDEAAADPQDCLRDIANLTARFASALAEEASPPVEEPAQWWAMLHPSVTSVAKRRFLSGHRADSVEAAMKEVNTRVKRQFKAARGTELDGAKLMNAAFSPDKPVIRLADLETVSGRDEQLGYMLIFAGSMEAIRNPKAHANTEIDEGRAIHHLFIASLLMQKLDEAGIP